MARATTNKKASSATPPFANFRAATQAEYEERIFVGGTFKAAWEGLQRLTARERTVAYLMADGQKNRPLAAKLGISPKTLDIHRANLMRKLGTKSQSEVVRTVFMCRVLTVASTDQVTGQVFALPE